MAVFLFAIGVAEVSASTHISFGRHIIYMLTLYNKTGSIRADSSLIHLPPSPSPSPGGAAPGATRATCMSIRLGICSSAQKTKQKQKKQKNKTIKQRSTIPHRYQRHFRFFFFFKTLIFKTATTRIQMQKHTEAHKESVTKNTQVDGRESDSIDGGSKGLERRVE
jgi:CCR4-NOT transcriptional regulation complex NOT5 subunit